jgi:HKD family nuclease
VASAKEEILMLLFQHTTISNIFLIEENVQKIMELLIDAVIENGVRVRILTSNYMHEQIERIIGRQKLE